MHQLHHQIEHAVDLAGIVEADDIWVFQITDGFGFSPQLRVWIGRVGCG